MSLLNEIEKIMSTHKNYLYQRILNYIHESSNKYINDNYSHINKDEYSFRDRIKIILKKFTDDNKIIVEIPKNSNSPKNEAEQYLVKIIDFLEKKNENLRVVHAKILKNLLTRKKLKKDTKDNFDFNYQNTFTIYDFIINYSKVAIEILFNKDFSQKDFDELNDLYLLLIFQIKDSENLKKLKFLIYTYLYEKKNIKEFIINSSEEILSKGNIEISKLRNFEKKYEELNIIVNKVSKEKISLFEKDLKKSDDDIFNFFNSKNIINNFSLIECQNKRFKENEIVIDDLNYDNKNKIHLFSPEFLIVNGLKSKFEDSDFEVFNKDNYSVDLFSKFLKRIIVEFNKYLDNNNFINEFMEKHLINFHRKNLVHYLSAKLDYSDKVELYKIINQNIDKNSFIKIKIYQQNNKEEINFQEPKNSFGRSDILSKSKISSNNSYLDEVKLISDDLENLINTKLMENVSEDKLISLPNIIFIFNLKIPKFNELNNTIEFNSAHLDYFSEQNTGENNNMYGFKEIDSVFQNDSKDFINVGDLEYFHINLKYIKDKNKDYFFLSKYNEEKFNVYPQSIFFLRLNGNFQIFLLEMKNHLN